MASFHPCLMVIPISHEGDVTVKCDIDIDICIFLHSATSPPSYNLSLQTPPLPQMAFEGFFLRQAASGAGAEQDRVLQPAASIIVSVEGDAEACWRSCCAGVQVNVCYLHEWHR